MTKEQEWLARQQCVARQDLERATRELFHRAPGAAKQFVADHPGTSIAVAAAAGFATGFTAVRSSTSDPSPPSPSKPRPPEENRIAHESAGWMRSATQVLRAFVSAAAFVKAASREMNATHEEPEPARDTCPS